jgi:hypothetical protein
MLTDLIRQTEHAVTGLGLDAMYYEYQSDTPDADACDKFLCSVAAGSVDTSDTTRLAARLLTMALRRAWDVMVMDCCDADEDHHYVVSDWYQQRVRWFRRALADVAVRGPMEIARNSQWILGGLTDAMTRRGAKDPGVVAAWEQVKAAVAEVYPRDYTRIATAHQTAYERFVARHMEQAS